jgi:putative ABC transport system substrate-binding protein
MKRREFIAFLGTMAIAAPRAAAAQTSKIYRLGTLTVGPPIASTNGPGAILIKGLAQRGYSLGQNLAYEARGAAGKISQMPNLVQELKAANVDVVVTVGYPAATTVGRPDALAAVAAG